MIPRLIVKSFRPSTLPKSRNLIATQPPSLSSLSSIKSFSSNASSLPSGSSGGGSLFSRLTGSSSDEEKYAEQLYEMARAETWTLSHFSKNLKSMSGGWKTKVPFLSGTEQVQQVKKMEALVDAAIAVVGGNAGANELKDIRKKEKLMICLKAKSDLQEVNSLIAQFESMDMLQRVLKYRLDSGEPVPTSEESAKKVMQSDLKKVLTDGEWKALQRRQMKAMGRR
eukprot:CAMPEP_0203662946 /NCGR_PEP_ID=MMETSP0090-20130426/735_1 /ASSEMBLY_ACC=CAM_ASM_001088 /TAXON_ID=426623 /ORGANISM="Chaetoceros affinis, Strain CCMP159" /LENGTH=224 /DNA_ID=CAMNT_0050525799 /DNA_START=12 /DNA_END=686 /DNA_ORIENTATION=+